MGYSFTTKQDRNTSVPWRQASNIFFKDPVKITGREKKSIRVSKKKFEIKIKIFQLEKENIPIRRKENIPNCKKINIPIWKKENSGMTEECQEKTNRLIRLPQLASGQNMFNSCKNRIEFHTTLLVSSYVVEWSIEFFIGL